METAKETVKQKEEKGQESKTIEEEWEEIKRIIHGAMVRKKIKKKRKKLGFKDWWDRSCTRKKREVKRIYIKWKKGKIEKEKYMVEKRKFRELLEMKQKEKKGRRGRRIKEDEKGSGGLEIYKPEERKKWNENNIREEWRNYFRNLLKGAEEEIIEKKEKRGTRGGGDRRGGS